MMPLVGNMQAHTYEERTPMLALQMHVSEATYLRYALTRVRQLSGAQGFVHELELKRLERVLIEALGHERNMIDADMEVLRNV